MKIYLVGGAVRDKLLNIPVKDRDWVVIGATPEEMIEKGFKAVGDDFPVFLHPETKEKSQEVVTVNSLYQAKQETVVVREDPYRNSTKAPERFARMWTTEKTIPKYFSVKIPVSFCS